MLFTDPSLRAIAEERVARLRRLADDLAGIVQGDYPSAEQLASAVVLRGALVSEMSVPVLIGMAENHPRLGSRVITTSQVYAIDPDFQWARTLSRFYRLIPPRQIPEIQPGTLQ